jgi:lipoic acid synthetase
VLTIGQYLRPSPEHAEVIEYVQPERFDKYREMGMNMGFAHVESGPLVRSSYHAERHVQVH